MGATMEESQVDSTPSSPSSSDSGEPKRRWLTGVVVLLLLGGFAAILLFAPAKLTPAPLLGSEAPDFEITAINGAHAGRRFSLRDLRGQIVVLNFWASWCRECDTEMKELEQAWRTYSERGVLFLGAGYMDFDDKALAYLERFGITYPSGPDMGAKISRSFRLTGVPETYFIDREGVVRHIRIGPISAAELRYQIGQLLEQAP
jgi:cytochrome c biogenesis protein CcmG/thiol:disulfide interchange protein DsbE